MRFLRLLAAILILQTSAFALDDPTLLEIECGKISGSVDKEVRAYKGIPFAASTAGEMRWKPPQPRAAWEGVRACTDFGPDCPQLDYAKDSIYYRPAREQSEDCLSLNVWTAAKSADEKRPVMVWIHGGALTRGSGATPTYDGVNFARKGVVLVTINYRLGPFGYLAHPDLTAESKHKSSGNYGVLDQIAALKWVKENIAAFGGDPGRVTIFGESAGSFSVNVLCASPLAAGLFHRAIGQSGGMFRGMTDLHKQIEDRVSAEEMGKGFFREAAADSLAVARALPSDKILETFAKFPQKGTFNSSPNVDGWVLSDEIRNIFAQGKQNDVPTIVGSNAKEMTTLTPAAGVPKTLASYEGALKGRFNEHTAKIMTLYPAATDAEVADAFFAATGDSSFTVNMRAWARAAAKGKSKSYWYYFTRVPPLPNHEYNGAFHAAEIAYVFGNLTGPGRQYEDADRKLSETMSSYWINFAKTGDPNGEGLPFWPAFDEAHEPYMILGEEVKSEGQLNKAKLDVIEELMLK